MKKGISIIFFFSMLLSFKNTKAQSCDTLPYQHIYYNKNFHDTRIKNFYFTANSDIFFLGYVSQKGNTDAWLMRTTFHGTPLWSKAIGTPSEEVINGVKQIKDGNFLISGNTRFNSFYETGWLAKIDSTGQPLWSIKLKSSNGTLFQVTELDNGDLVAVGTLYLKFNGDNKGNIVGISGSSNFIMRLDKDGNLIWQRSFHYTNRERLYKVQQLADGNLLVTGDVIDGGTAYIIKLDQHSGKIIWMNQYENAKAFNNAKTKENADRSISFSIENHIYSLTPDGKFTNGSFKIDLNSNNLTLDNIQVADFGSPSPGNEIYFANIKPKPVLFNVKNNSIVNWAHVYNFYTSDVNLAGGRVFKKNIYLTGLYNADKVSDSTSGEHMAYLLKTNFNGETFCADTFNIGFKISLISSAKNISHEWIDEGRGSPEFISLYSKNIEPVRLLDCTQQICCNDTVLSYQAQLCDNKYYKLPEGKIVNTPGFYTSRFYTPAGCDSIIYTNLSQQKTIDLHLIKDTCLINNLPVTFVLPTDTSLRYRWQDGSHNFKYTADVPGKYWVTAISACNAVTDTVNVHNKCDEEVFIPSAFTPDKNGLNDIFHIPEINGQHLSEFTIYNRYGKLIFKSGDLAKGWDGSLNNIPQPSGTYIYLIRYFDITGKPHLLKGTVVLIR